MGTLDEITVEANTYEYALMKVGDAVRDKMKVELYAMEGELLQTKSKQIVGRLHDTDVTVRSTEKQELPERMKNAIAAAARELNQ